MVALTPVQCAIRAGITLIAWLYFTQTQNDIAFSQEQLARCDNESNVSQCIFDIYNREGAITAYHYSIGKHTPLVSVHAERVCENATDIIDCLMHYRYGFDYYHGIYTRDGCGIITDITDPENDTQVVYVMQSNGDNQMWLTNRHIINDESELIELFGDEFYVAAIADTFPSDMSMSGSVSGGSSMSEKNNDEGFGHITRDLLIALISLAGGGGIGLIVKYIIGYCKARNEMKPAYPAIEMAAGAGAV